MCGRYLLWESDNQDIEKLVSYAEQKLSPEVFASIALHEVTPGSYCFSCVAAQNTIHTGIMKWGFQRKGKLVINARSETCLTSAFFKNAKPCVLPCTGYYEWDRQKTKHLITGTRGIQYLGGLYHKENGIPVFVVVTQPADPSIVHIHDRQPLLFDKRHAKLWCISPSTQLFSASYQKRNAQPL